MTYTLLDSDEKIFKFLDSISSLDEIAVDFEGEFNLHIYGEHLCLIQIFDKSNYYIIDPRSKCVSEKGIIAFLTSPIRKIWFDAQSDNALVYKAYKTTIENVYDVRALAKALGFMGNLVSLEETYLKVKSEVVDKKRLQQTNWLKRPLSEEQICYALSDVEHLFDLKSVLIKEVEDKNLTKNAEYLLKCACNKPKLTPPWTKLCSTRELSKEQRLALEEYFIARDVVAKRFNVPSYYVLDKHKIVELAKKNPKSLDEVYSIMGPCNQRFELFLRSSMKNAFDHLR